MCGGDDDERTLLGDAASHDDVVLPQLHVNVPLRCHFLAAGAEDGGGSVLVGLGAGEIGRHHEITASNAAPVMASTTEAFTTHKYIINTSIKYSITYNSNHSKNTAQVTATIAGTNQHHSQHQIQ